MTKTISKVGNSQGIIFDAALMDLARLKVGDEVDVTVIPESGAVVVMPTAPCFFSRQFRVPSCPGPAPGISPSRRRGCPGQARA